MQPQGSMSPIESLNIASKPIMAAILARKEDKARTAEAERQRASLSQALGLPQPKTITMDDVTGGPSTSTTIQPAMSDQQKQLAALLGGLPQQGIQAAQMSVLQQALQPAGGEGFTLGPGQKRFDATGREIASVEKPLDSDTGLPKLVNDISDDLYKESSDFALQLASMGRIRQSATEPSAAGDMALIFNYMKLLDPNSVVREAEYATAENARSVPASIRNVWNRLMNGERLAEEQRGDFLNRAERLFSQARADQGRRNDRFLTRATSLGVPKDMFQPLLLPLDPASMSQQQTTPQGVPPQAVPAPVGPTTRRIP